MVSGGTVFTSRLIDVCSPLAFPAASANAPRPTVITPSSVLFSDGVKLALYSMPLPLKPLSVPPLTTTSSAVKSLDASDNEKRIVAVSSTTS